MKRSKKIFIGSVLFCMLAVTPIMAGSYVLSGTKWAWIFIHPLQYYDTSGYDEVADAKDDWNAAVDDITLSTGGSNCLYKIKNEEAGEEYDCVYLYQPLAGYFIWGTIWINDDRMSGYDSDTIKSCIAHEMGHAFGLGDRDFDVEVLMNNHTQYRCNVYEIYTPQSDDAEGVDSIY